MALQELSAPPPITGYAQLGQQLANFGQQVRAERLKTADEERQVALEQSRHERGRGEALKDVASQREYETKVREEQNKMGIDKEKLLADYRSRQAVIAAMVGFGLLSMQDANDDAKVMAAMDRYQELQYDKVMAELMTTLDANGLPLITRDSIYDPAAIKKGWDALNAIKGKLRQSEAEIPANKQAAAAEARDDKIAAQAALDNLDVKIANARDDEPKQPTYTKIRAAAYDIAKSKLKAGEFPSPKQVEAEMGVAQKEAESEYSSKMISLDKSMKLLESRRALAANRLNNATIREDTLARVGGFADRNAVVRPSTTIQDQSASQEEPPTVVGEGARAKFIEQKAPPPPRTDQPKGASLVPPPASGKSPPAASVTPGPAAQPPPVFTAAPSASGQQAMTRRNEAVGDTMRAVSQTVGNFFRPSSWHGDMDSASFEADPDVLLPQLKARLASLSDQTSETATALKNAIYALEQKGRGIPFSPLPSADQVTAAPTGRPLFDSTTLFPPDTPKWW